MLDKILRVLDADPGFDDRVGIASLVGSYIKRNINGSGVEMTPEYLKELAFPDRNLIKEKKEREDSERFTKYVYDEMEKHRIEKIRESNTNALSTIYNKTKELRTETDKITLKSEQIEQNLSVRQEDLRKKLESLQEENKDFLERELEQIRSGEREMAERFASNFQAISDKIPVIADELKSTVSEFENRLRAEKQADIEAKEPEPTYEQVLIAETGQIIEVMREDG